jgi:hypothetical protein
LLGLAGLNIFQLNATFFCPMAASGFNLKKILRALALFAPKMYALIMALLKNFIRQRKIRTNTASRNNMLVAA